MELEEARNEVFRKVGRNMLLFQHVEHLLRFLIANGQVSGNIGGIQANKEQRAGIHNLLLLAQEGKL